MKNYTCSECGQYNGHFWNCPEMPEPDGDEIQADAEPEEDEPLYQDQTQNAPTRL